MGRGDTIHQTILASMDPKERARVTKIAEEHQAEQILSNLFILAFYACIFLSFVFWIMKLAQLGLVADWSWMRVFSPLWAPLVALLAVFFGGCFLKCFFYLWRSVARLFVGNK